MITLEATQRVAKESPDHQCPIGCVNDNFTSVGLINEVKDGFDNEQLFMLDLGCAGGQFVSDFIARGDIGVGLEGSDNALSGAGKNNWDKYYNKNLFLCDITKEYQLFYNDKPIEFDFIHSEEVFEHISPEDIDSLLKNIFKHLKKGGLCVFGISLVPDVRDENGNAMVPPFAKEDMTIGYEGKLFKLHQSIFPAVWWKNKIESHGFKIFEEGLHNDNCFGYLFNHTVRGAGPESVYICCTK
jgi:SAM-dependent methyltransferase